MTQLRLHALQQRLQLLGLALGPRLQLLHDSVEVALELLVTLLEQEVRVGRGRR